MAALQEDPLPDIEQRLALVERLYTAIKPIVLQPEADRPAWWRNLKVYTQSDTFQPPNKVVLPDDGLYREIFQGSVPYAWRPPKDASVIGRPSIRRLGRRSCPKW